MFVKEKTQICFDMSLLVSTCLYFFSRLYFFLLRCLSALKDLRVTASSHLSGPSNTEYDGDKAEFIEAIRQALYASKIISYAQGFMLMRQAAKEFGWTLNYGGWFVQFFLY